MRRRLLQTLAMTILLVTGSLRAIVKYLPHPEVLIILSAALVFIFLDALIRRVKDPKTATFLRGRGGLCTCLLLLGAFLAVSFFVYPIADARRNLGLGSTADDAMIEAVASFLRSGDMYAAYLSGGTPVSPGPGWVLLNIPFAGHRQYWLMSPFYIALSVLVLRRVTGSYLPPAFALLSVCSCLLFWELLVTGHDIVAMGFAFALLAALVHRGHEDGGDGLGPPILLGLLTGIVATCRVVFSPLPLAWAFLAFKFGRRFAVTFGITGQLTVFLIHGLFYALSDVYQPLHLLGRGRANVGAGLIAVGLVLEPLVLWLLWKRYDGSLASWLGSACLLLLVPLGLIAVGELRSVGERFDRWEGANYLFPYVPLLLFYVGSTLEPRSASPSSSAEHRRGDATSRRRDRAAGTPEHGRGGSGGTA